MTSIIEYDMDLTTFADNLFVCNLNDTSNGIKQVTIQKSGDVKRVASFLCRNATCYIIIEAWDNVESLNDFFRYLYYFFY